MSDNRVLRHYEQCELLRSKGIIIEDEAYAIKVLSSVNYYRFSEYFRHMTNEELMIKKPMFEEIYQLYCFDAELRHLLMRLIEKIEISVRAKISYVMAVNYGPECYLDYNNFKSKREHARFLREFKLQVKRKKHLQIKHREDENEISIWEGIEIFTFGMLSNFYSNMKIADQERVAEQFGITPPYMQSWLSCIVELRNACAHYNKVFNNRFYHHPKLEKKFRSIPKGSLFSMLVIIKKLTGGGHSWSAFSLRLNELIKRYYYVDVEDMGFIENWREIL